MIKFLLLASCFIPLSLFCQSSRQEQLKTWGYIHHIARLENAYLQQTIPRYSVVCISGFSIYGSGKIVQSKNQLTKKTMSIAARHKTMLYPMLTFASVNEGKKLLQSPLAISTAIKNIHRLLEEHNLKGIHLDFEYLPASYAEKLALFLKALKSELAQKQTILSMAIFPPVDFPKQWAGFHDLAHISKHLDQVVVMCYDYHRNGTKPGPVTGVTWAEKNIQHALLYFKPNQVWLGMPAYGYHWHGSRKATVISSRYGVNLAKKVPNTRHRSGTIHMRREINGITNHYYFADSITRDMLRNLAMRYQLRGTAIWRLGLE